MKIGILSAMPEENHLISSNITGKKITSLGNRDYAEGELGNHDVIAAFSRWGKVAAAQAATTLITKFGAEKIIFTGVAGAASDELEIGDIVISKDLIQHDMDASAIPAFAKFEIPLLGITHFHADHDLLQIAEEAARSYLGSILSSDIPIASLEKYNIYYPKVIAGTIATGDQFIADHEKIRMLQAAIPNLKCIEMEGAAVAQVAHEHQIPFVVIRSISDKANANAMQDFPHFVSHIASHYSLGIVNGMLANL
jgi:adenosylhomocysteine nucleosidase